MKSPMWLLFLILTLNQINSSIQFENDFFVDILNDLIDKNEISKKLSIPCVNDLIKLNQSVSVKNRWALKG
jgi:hypothetical protein